ncbi:FG-GAP repeat domain protein [Nitrosococcus oceani AFC27]|nr:FG-GAP repeat domain protein [Nitrosococcus oceani AFC27]
MPCAPAPRPLAVALRRVLGGGLLAVGLAGPALSQNQDPVLSAVPVPNQSKSLELSTLDGSNGFVFNSPATSVSGAGDVNGDGFDDLVFGNPYASPNGLDSAGQSYVVFGTGGDFPAALSSSDLNGDNGFTLNGIATYSYSGLPDKLGSSVSSAGDMNGDGFDDILVGASGVHTFKNGDITGQSYVVFGTSGGFPPALERSDLGGSNGFVIRNILSGDYSGFSVSGAGDIDGDGFDDVLIGAKNLGRSGDYSVGYADETYVIFGDSDGTSGNKILADTTNAYSESFTTSVSGAGDVNGDGLNDMLLSTSGSPSGGGSDSDVSAVSKIYVVFGMSGQFSDFFNLSNLDGDNGFIITNSTQTDNSLRYMVSGAGDVNGDGFDDLVFGNPYASPNGLDGAGQSYVVFGTDGGFPAALDLSTLDGSNGFVLNGIEAGDHSGRSVSGAGDVNGDGFDDLVIGAPGAGLEKLVPKMNKADLIGAFTASPNGLDSSGQGYVVFGMDGGFPAALELSELDGSNGFIINGIGPGGRLGQSVSGAGDVNGDGLADIVIGAGSKSYVVFGTASGGPAVLLKGLIAEVGALDLPAGLEHWLTRPLKRAERKLAQGEVAKALYKVVGFIQRARVLRKYGILPAAEANALIAQAKAIIKALLDLPQLSGVAASDLLPADLVPIDEPVPRSPSAPTR